MRIKTTLITLSLSWLFLGVASCPQKPTQPRMPNIKTCRYIKGEVLQDDFLYCKLINGGEWEEIIKIIDIPKVPETPKDAVMCTTMNNDAAMRAWARETQIWINNNCQ